jgi:NitT/TauT family transport system ATP-binding protein
VTKILEVSHLQKSFGGPNGVPVLTDVTFSVRQGEFLSLVGPSGCGKTTLLLSLSGLLPYDGGEILFDGAPVVGGTPAGVAIVFQDYSRSLLPWRTNLENVMFGMRRVDELTKTQKLAAARELLSAVGLEGFENHYPWQVSGGMQQRVAIARGLASRSRLLLLDEPLAAVDAQTRSDMQDLILQLAEKFKQTCLLVTHDVDEAVYMADRVVVLSGRPTRVVDEIGVPLGKSRDQIDTREDPAFLRIRHDVLRHIRQMRHASSRVSVPQ